METKQDFSWFTCWWRGSESRSCGQIGAVRVQGEEVVVGQTAEGGPESESQSSGQNQQHQQQQQQQQQI